MDIEPIENLLPKANWSVYRLARMAAVRALELSEGKKCLSEHPVSEKVTTRALQEIYEGKVYLQEASDLVKKEKAERAEKEQVNEESQEQEVGVS